MIKFISDLRQVGGFAPDTLVSSTNNTDLHDITELLVESDIKYHNRNPLTIVQPSPGLDFMSDTVAVL